MTLTQTRFRKMTKSELKELKSGDEVRYVSPIHNDRVYVARVHEPSTDGNAIRLQIDAYRFTQFLAFLVIEENENSC